MVVVSPARSERGILFTRALPVWANAVLVRERMISSTSSYLKVTQLISSYLIAGVSFIVSPDPSTVSSLNMFFAWINRDTVLFKARWDSVRPRR